MPGEQTMKNRQTAGAAVTRLKEILGGVPDARARLQALSTELEPQHGEGADLDDARLGVRATIGSIVQSLNHATSAADAEVRAFSELNSQSRQPASSPNPAAAEE